MRRALWGGVALLAAAGGGWFARELVGFRAESLSAPVSAAPRVTAFVVTNAVFNPVREFVGRVEPMQEVDILPQIDGYVTAMRFAEGADVAAGDVLFEIDAERYAATARLRAAELQQARAQAAQALAARDKAARYLARLKGADDRGLAQTDLDAAEADEAAARAALESARAQVARAEASLALAEVDARHTAVRAPIAGRIGRALRHVGDYVSPSKGALARVVQRDPVRVTFPLSDREYVTWLEAAARQGTDVRASRRLRLRLPNGSTYPVEGVWEFDDNEMGASTATIQLRLSFANPQGLLVPNAYVRVLSDARDPATALVVPAASVETAADGAAVWVVRDDGTVARRAIVRGAAADGRVVVASGLAPGERVVHRGVHKLSEGLKVDWTEAE